MATPIERSITQLQQADDFSISGTAGALADYHTMRWNPAVPGGGGWQNEPGAFPSRDNAWPALQTFNSAIFTPYRLGGVVNAVLNVTNYELHIGGVTGGETSTTIGDKFTVTYGSTAAGVPRKIGPVKGTLVNAVNPLGMYFDLRVTMQNGVTFDQANWDSRFSFPRGIPQLLPDSTTYLRFRVTGGNASAWTAELVAVNAELPGLINGRVLNVKRMFMQTGIPNATGDGGSDDTVSIQAAIDYMARVDPTDSDWANQRNAWYNWQNRWLDPGGGFALNPDYGAGGGGTVYFPAGTYVHTDNIRLRPGVSLIGESPSTTILHLDNTTTDHGGSIAPNSFAIQFATWPGYGEGESDESLNNLIFSEIKNIGIWTDGQDIHAIGCDDPFVQLGNCRIENVDISSGGRGIWISSYTQHIEIGNVCIKSFGGEPILIQQAQVADIHEINVQSNHLPAWFNCATGSLITIGGSDYRVSGIIIQAVSTINCGLWRFEGPINRDFTPRGLGAYRCRVDRLFWEGVTGMTRMIDFRNVGAIELGSDVPLWDGVSVKSYGSGVCTIISNYFNAYGAGDTFDMIEFDGSNPNQFFYCNVLQYSVPGMTIGPQIIYNIKYQYDTGESGISNAPGLDQNIIFNDNGRLSTDVSDNFNWDKTNSTLYIPNVEVEGLTNFVDSVQAGSGLAGTDISISTGTGTLVATGDGAITVTKFGGSSTSPAVTVSSGTLVVSRAGAITVTSQPALPPQPASGKLTEYIRGHYRVLRYNNSGSDIYWYLDLTSASSTQTWLRSSFDPNDIPAPLLVSGCRLYVQSEDLLSVGNGNPISSWLDLSGHDNHGVASGSNRPVLTTNDVNGYPSVQFDTTDIIDFGNMASQIPTAGTLIVAVKVTASGYGGFTTKTSEDEYWRFSGGGSYLSILRSPRNEGNPATMPTSGAHVFTITSNSSNWKMYQDGSLLATIAAAFNAGNSYRIAPSTNADASARYLSVALYDNVIGSSDQTLVENFLKTKYAIP